MAKDDNATPQTPQPEVTNKPQWLREVEADAEFNYLQRKREQEERDKHEAEKANRTQTNNQ